MSKHNSQKDLSEAQTKLGKLTSSLAALIIGVDVRVADRNGWRVGRLSLPRGDLIDERRLFAVLSAVFERGELQLVALVDAQ